MVHHITPIEDDIYIPICLYFNDLISRATYNCLEFTFQYVSILICLPFLPIPGELHLHSNMSLF